MLRRFLPAGTPVKFIEHATRLTPDCFLYLWGSQPHPEPLPAGATIIRVEDGFLRSVGLGADLIGPLSWILDKTGIYYDSTRPSDLEHLLQNQAFNPDLLQRARSVRHHLVHHGLSKYNVGSTSWKRPANLTRVILVPGQVESDASIRFGAPGIQKNMTLLQTVRRQNPDAYILYKSHPDVIARLRSRGENESDAHQWCDEIITHASMGTLLCAVDEVHVMTSLSGFEALLRDKRVICYGQPFYAGWGLTEDMIPVPRRHRRLSIDELVAGALLLYPVYLSRSSRQQIPAEQAIHELLQWRNTTSSEPGLWRSAFRILLRKVVGVR